MPQSLWLWSVSSLSLTLPCLRFCVVCCCASRVSGDDSGIRRQHGWRGMRGVSRCDSIDDVIVVCLCSVPVSLLRVVQAVSASRMAWPLSEGAAVPLTDTSGTERGSAMSASHCSPGMCVSAVLGDALRRVAVLSGREGMSRSLGSVYGGSVTRFLGGGLQGIVSRVIATPGVRAGGSCMAVSRDGSTLLVSDRDGGSHAIHEYRVSDGSLLRVVGSRGDGPLQFKHPLQVWVADFVFVADHGNRRVQVLTPALDFHALVGVGELEYPVGVCANDAVVVASECGIHRISVFSRCDGALLRRFGSQGSGAGQLNWPLGLCFMANDRHVAVADHVNSRVSVFSVDGDFIRHVGVGVAYTPHGVACSAYDELVVADRANRAVVVLSDSGKVVKTLARGRFSGVAMYGGTVFAQNYGNENCVLFM